MKAQCLPFSQIPHTTRLFADFLAWSPKIQAFYPRSPHFHEWVKDETSRLRYDAAKRKRVAEVLKRQNQKWNASAKTLENLDRFSAGACAVVTGQQVGFLGGPAFSLYKALTAIKLAEEARAAGADCVPVFWLATEDHDLEEVSSVSLPGADGSLQTLTAPMAGLSEAPVGTVRLGPGADQTVAEAVGLLGESDITTLLKDCYREGETLGEAFARLLTQLLAQWGVILLDASDPALHEIARPIYRAAIERAAELDAALLERGKALEDAGYHQQVKVTNSSTLLFTLSDGARVAVHRQGESAGAGPEFVIGEKKISSAELLRRIDSAPHLFSPNVLLRPVVQDYLLPTLAYTGGAAEVAYFAQAGVVYQTLIGRVTPTIPRFSATIVESKPQALLEKYDLGWRDLVQGQEAVLQQIAGRALPGELQAAFDHAGARVNESFSRIRELLEQLDKTLVEAANNAAGKVHHQLEGLRARAARAELRQSEVLERHARLLSNALYPNKELQEREFAGIYFVARYGREFLSQLYDTMKIDCLDHQVISVS